MSRHPGLADDLMRGAVAHGNLGRCGARQFRRMWFNFASGHFVADAGSVFMWANDVNGPWRIVPQSTPVERENGQ